MDLPKPLIQAVKPRDRHQIRAILLAPVALSLVTGGAPAGTVIPTDGMVITENTTFEPGTYNLPNGVSIGASSIVLDMNGAELIGTNFQNYGITCIGHDNVAILAGIVRNYYYGIRVESGTDIQISQNDLSNNWVDPASLGNSAPFLNINVGPNLDDTTNLGGGLFMRDVTIALVNGNTLAHQENGMDLYFVHSAQITNNNASDNTGWGIHLHGSMGNFISANVADRCIRTPLGDSAGALLVKGSHKNCIMGNSFQYCGDGFFIGNEHGCPSIDRLRWPR